MGDTVHIILPGRDEDALSDMLIRITKEIEDREFGGPDGFGLGGAYGYGADYDSDMFMMHRYCWCESDACPWCEGCDCPDGSSHYFVDGAEVSYEEWAGFYSRTVTADICKNRPLWERQSAEANARRATRHDPVCPYCTGDDPTTGKIAAHNAPNFWHKPTGMRVWWYKYIGRGMETHALPDDLAPILAECLADIAKRIPEKDATHDHR